MSARLFQCRTCTEGETCCDRLPAAGECLTNWATCGADVPHHSVKTKRALAETIVASRTKVERRPSAQANASGSAPGCYFRYPRSYQTLYLARNAFEESVVPS